PAEARPVTGRCAEQSCDVRGDQGLPRDGAGSAGRPSGRAAAPGNASVRLRAAEHPRQTVEPGLLPGDAAIILVIVQDVAAGGRVPGAPEHVHTVVHAVGEEGYEERARAV